MNRLRLSVSGLLLVVAALALPGSAFAFANLETRPWLTGSSPSSMFVLSGSRILTVSGASFELTTTVGSTPLRITSSGIGCTGCLIQNEGGSARGSGKLSFPGAQVASTCAVSGGRIETWNLSLEADYMEGSKSLILFRPAAGETLATVTLTKGSGSCPLAGSYVIRGVVFGQQVNATGVYSVLQNVWLSQTINTIAGGALKFGAAEAALTGTAQLETGTYFGVQ
jgi:hypothetical protein